MDTKINTAHYYMISTDVMRRVYIKYWPDHVLCYISLRDGSRVLVG